MRFLGGRDLISLAGLGLARVPLVWSGACMESAVVSSVAEGTAVRLSIRRPVLDAALGAE
jgi:hypothetical protein